MNRGLSCAPKKSALLQSGEGPGSRVLGANARGLPPEADERVAGFRTGVDVPAAPTPS